VQLLSYFDSSRRAVNGGSSFTVNTYDLELQHNFTVAGWNNIVWGVGERNFDYSFENTSLALVPANQRLNLANIFAQDTISLTSSLKVTLGLKLEADPYAAVQAMPSIRLAWKATDALLLWSAVSRAERSPTPVDTNLREFNGPIDTLNGSGNFRPELLTAYEVGLRVQVSPRASFSISGYYDVYDHLRSINPSPSPFGIPFYFGNAMQGNVFGVEAWGNLQLTDWWRLTGGVSALHEDLKFEPGSSRVLGLAFVANDPGHQATLQSSMNFGHGVVFWSDLREVGALSHPVVAGYTEGDARLSWDVTNSVQVSLAGYNLLKRQHLEFLEPGQTSEIPRSFYAQTRVRF